MAPNAFPVLTGDKNLQFVGGAEVQQVMVAKGLRDRGHCVSMICLDFGQSRITNIDGITVYRAFHPAHGVPVLRFLWPRLTSVWRCLRNADADIYYYRTAGMWAGVIAAYGRRYGKRSVFAAAGNPDLELNTSKIRFARDRWLYEYGLRNVDRIFVQNQAQADLCSSNFSRNPVLIPNCCQPAAKNSSHSGRKILWVSTIRPIKHPEIFLDLVQALPQYHFQMVGGPSATDIGLFESIKGRSAELSNLEFVGYVPYSEVGQYFDGAAVFVNTSESEGFPNTFLQSWVRGIPTVSFVDSGARYNSRPLGRRVNSTSEMVATLAELMEDITVRQTLGAECMRYVEEYHSLDRILDRYEEVFYDLVSQNFGCRNGLG